MNRQNREQPEYMSHPIQKPRVPGELSAKKLEEFFRRCADFGKRTLWLAGTEQQAILCWINGMVKMERVNEYIIRPLVEEGGPRLPGEARRVLEGGVWNMTVEERTTMDEVTEDLVNGSCALFLPGTAGALTILVPTEEKRSISSPEIESVVKGPKDSFVESLRTNTSLLRRRLRTPYLRLEEQIVGRQSLTPVDVVWVEGITNPELVAETIRRISCIDIDAMLSTGHLEEYIVDDKVTTFPQVIFTERPDRFCTSLMDGRVGILIDGLSMGCLVPADIAQMIKAPQDKSYNYATTGILTVIRYACMAVTLLLPAFYIAVATFHPEMIPTKLALSVIASKQDVPFVTAFEVLVMLVAFEVLQEAGLRLPQTIGQTVSIIGGLVVGQSAVEAKIVSPVVVIVVATAGIAGFTMPNQDFANALRIWRFGLAVAASAAGLFGLMSGCAALVYHLASIESFGEAYLTPFAPNPGTPVGAESVLRRPLPKMKLRDLALRPRNRRNQK